jgi:hypothetical protein
VGILSTLYCSTNELTVGTALWLTGVSTASRSAFAARHADAFVGYCLTLPIFFDRRLPFSHQKKFQVLLRLSKTTLPSLFRALIESSRSREQQTAL